MSKKTVTAKKTTKKATFSKSAIDHLDGNSDKNVNTKTKAILESNDLFVNHNIKASSLDNFNEFIKSRCISTKYVYNKYPLFYNNLDRNFVVLYKNYFILQFNLNHLNHLPPDLAKINPSAIQTDQHFLINADEDVLNLTTHPLLKDQPTFSFNCLAQFYNQKLFPTLNKLVSGEISLVDFDCSESKNFTKDELKQLKKDKNEVKKNPPGLGFSMTGLNWHKSGSVLLYDSKIDKSILLGQDEGTYFGCELVDNPKSVKQAFQSLIPKEVGKKKFIRQGEWFFINVDKKDVPKLTDCCLSGSYYTGGIHLPLESEDSNKHEISDCSELRVDCSGRVFVLNPTISHNQHEDLTMNGWCRFYKNTALRSFSEEGVD